MNSYLLTDHFLQYALNALVGFFLFSFIIYALIKLFNIKNHRLRASLKLVPLLKLILDPAFYFLPLQVSFINMNVFGCSHPLQKFLWKGLSEATKHDLSLYGLKTVIGSFLVKIPLVLVEAGLISIALISLLRLGSFLIKYRSSVKTIKKIIKSGSLYLRPIFNQSLLKKLNKKKAKIILSNRVKVPLANWGQTIILPKDFLDELSQEELESVIAHELEHLRWHDTLVRMTCLALSAIYWWIPVNRLVNKLKCDQEKASDHAVYQYKIKGTDLASALVKTVKKHRPDSHSCAAFASCATPAEKSALKSRIKAVLCPESYFKQNKLSATVGVITLIGITLILGFIIC